MTAKQTKTKADSGLTERPPVVVIVGHIDHGKTTLLDYIRKTNIAGRESGGITQHTAAYEIEHPSTSSGQVKKITFIDTPGHEAFSSMRKRGANVADIAVLVIAADEGMKQQTNEALDQILESGSTLVVAINKIDKPEANVQRIKQQLAEKGILLEGWGGTVLSQELSAKTGKGVPEFLDLLLLATEMEELRADPKAAASGVILEAHKDAKTGIVATLLITNGTLRHGEYVVSETAMGKIKSMQDAQGDRLDAATFSSPVVITGFEELPAAGNAFVAAADKKTALALKKEKPRAGSQQLAASVTQEGKPELGVIIKSDAYGTSEALEKLINGLQFKNAGVRILKSDVGDLNESDVLLAKSSHAVIAAFKIGIPNPVAKLIQFSGVSVLSADVVYNLVDAIKEKMQDLLPPEVTRTDLGKLAVLATFKSDTSRMIVGGKITDGKIKKGAKIDVKRKGLLLFSGKISQLQHNKKDMDEVSSGNECGIMVSQLGNVGDKKIETGDDIVIYEEQAKPKALEPLEQSLS